MRSVTEAWVKRLGTSTATTPAYLDRDAHHGIRIGDNVLRVSLPRGVAGNLRDCEVMIDQSRAIDNRRFRQLLGRLPGPLMREVKNQLRQLAEL
jgi:hypothetical protein